MRAERGTEVSTPVILESARECHCTNDFPGVGFVFVMLLLTILFVLLRQWRSRTLAVEFIEEFLPFTEEG